MCIYKDRFKTLNHVFMVCIMWMEISKRETFQKACHNFASVFLSEKQGKWQRFFIYCSNYAVLTFCICYTWGSIKKTYWAF